MPGVSVPKEDEEKIMHIGLPLGNDFYLMGTDTLPSLGQKLNIGNNSYISIHPHNREEADRLFTALSSGGKVEMPITDQPCGDYYSCFSDKFGVQWMINYSDQNKKRSN